MQNRSARTGGAGKSSRSHRQLHAGKPPRFIESLESRLLMSVVRAPIFIKPGNVPSVTDATVTLNPAQSFQTINGLGVNLSSAAWNNGAAAAQIDTLTSTMGASLFRVIVEAVQGWEDTNDNNDPFVANTAYYNNLYSTTKFTNLWNTIKYLNDRNQPVLLNVMGYLPQWLGGAGTIPTNLVDEFVEMEATMLDYAVHTKGLSIDYFSVLNEQDWGHNEGPLLGTTTAGVNLYVDIVNKMITRMNGLGLSSIQILGGETATNSTQYANALMTSPAAMARITHFGFHDYTDSVGQFAGFDQHAAQSGYPNRNFWVTEYAELVNLDNGGDPPNEWTFSENSTKYLIDYLNNGASGATVYDGIDAQYQHHNFNVSTYGMIKWDSVANTYLIRKRMYANAQVTRFVRPGMKRITSSDANANLIQTSFYDAASGQLAVIAQNLSNASMTVQVNLGGIALTSLEVYQTNTTLNLARQADVPVAAGSVMITIPAHTIVTLASPDTTAPIVTMPPVQPAPVGGAGSYDFTINLSDAGVGGVDLASLGNTDIRVTGPNGFDQLAVLVGTDYLANGSPRIATYRIAAPGGFWDSLDNGTYSVAVEAAQIKDAHNNFAASATLGTITVNASFAVINPSGTLVINGTSAGDAFTLGTSGSNITVLRGVTNLAFGSAGITSILVNGYEDNDQLNINASISQPISFQGAGGTNAINATAGDIALSGDLSAKNVQTLNISGSSIVSFNTNGSVANLNLTGGSLSGSGDLTITQSATWSGGSLAGSGALIIAPGAILDISVNGEATSTRPLQVNGRINLVASGTRLLRTQALSLGANGILDLADNALLIDYAVVSPIVGIMAKLQSGYANGIWNGLGIVSSAAAGSPLTRTLGIADAANIYSTFPATFAGYNVPDNSALLIRYTQYGDANLDRTTDIRDLYFLASNWQQNFRRWDQGDFNFDQVTNAADLGLLSSNWQMSFAIPPDPVMASAEPALPRAPKRTVRMLDLAGI